MIRAANHRRRGFTLVEVLATLVLVAVILPVAMSAITLSTRAAGQAKRRMEAVSLAEMKLTELLATGDWSAAELSGDFGADRPDYRWQAEAVDYDGVTVRQLTVMVLWTDRTETRRVSLTTLVYDVGQIE